MLTIRRRANRGGEFEPYSLFLWRCGRRSDPSLGRWGDVLVTSDPVRHRSSRAASERARRSACGTLWIDYARGRGSVSAEAEPWWCNTPVLRSYLAPRFRSKSNFQNKFLGIFDLKRTCRDEGIVCDLVSWTQINAQVKLRST